MYTASLSFNRAQLRYDYSLPEDTSDYDDAIERAIISIIETKNIDHLCNLVDSKTWDAILKALEPEAELIVKEGINDEIFESETVVEITQEAPASKR